MPIKFFNVAYCLLPASQYRYAENYGLDGINSLGDRNPIRHGSAQSGGSYGQGGGRYERAVGTTAQIQSPDVVRATSQINSPLYPLDHVQATSPMPQENATGSYVSVEKNEIPLNHPRQDESRLLKHLLTNYDKRVRPILNAKKNITIYVGITLTQIFDMVSILFVFVISFYLSNEYNSTYTYIKIKIRINFSG